MRIEGTELTGDVEVLRVEDADGNAVSVSSAGGKAKITLPAGSTGMPDGWTANDPNSGDLNMNTGVLVGSTWRDPDDLNALEFQASGYRRIYHADGGHIAFEVFANGDVALKAPSWGDIIRWVEADNKLSFGGLAASDLDDPVVDTDAATKGYVDRAWRVVDQTADQAVINSTTLVDSELTFSMLANTKYRIRAVVFFDATGAGDFKYKWSAPAATALVRSSRRALPAADTNNTNWQVDDSLAVTQEVLGAGGAGMARLDVIVHNGPNPGNFTFTFAQNTATADTGAVVSAASYLEYAVVA